MDEAGLKRSLVTLGRAKLPSFVFIRHEERFNSGTPDLSVTGNGVTSWWEVKFANPRFKSIGIQEYLLKRLASSGYARYIIFGVEKDGSKWTSIVHPRDIADWKTNWIGLVDGHDYDWLIEAIRHAHDHHIRPH